MKRRSFILDSCKACMALAIGATLPTLLPLDVYAKGKAKIIKTNMLEDGTTAIELQLFEKNNIYIIRIADKPFDVIVRKTEENSFLAMYMMCTHAKHPLTLSGSKLICLLHGSKFDASGEVLKGPASKALVHLDTVIDNNLLIINTNV